MQKGEIIFLGKKIPWSVQKLTSVYEDLAGALYTLEGRSGLTKGQFQQFMQTLQIPLPRAGPISSPLNDRIFAVFNQRKTGKVNLEDTLHVFSVFTGGNLDEILKLSFRAFDMNLTGKITYTEMQTTLKALCAIVYPGEKSELLHVFVSEVMAQYNTDNEAEHFLTLEQFCQVARISPKLTHLFALGSVDASLSNNNNNNNSNNNEEENADKKPVRKSSNEKQQQPQQQQQPQPQQGVRKQNNPEQQPQQGGGRGRGRGEQQPQQQQPQPAGAGRAVGVKPKPKPNPEKPQQQQPQQPQQGGGRGRGRGEQQPQQQQPQPQPAGAGRAVGVKPKPKPNPEKPQQPQQPQQPKQQPQQGGRGTAVKKQLQQQPQQQQQKAREKEQQETSEEEEEETVEQANERLVAHVRALQNELRKYMKFDEENKAKMEEMRKAGLALRQENAELKEELSKANENNQHMREALKKAEKAKVHYKKIAKNKQTSATGEQQQQQQQQQRVRANSNSSDRMLIEQLQKENQHLMGVSNGYNAMLQYMVGPRDVPHKQYVAMRDTKVVKVGYMVKRGDLVKSWKRRLFLLRENMQLIYYAVADRPDPKGIVDLKDAVMVREAQSLENAIEVITKSRSWILACDSSEEVADWIRILSALIESHKLSTVRNSL